jgi:hypothetical protein
MLLEMIPGPTQLKGVERARSRKHVVRKLDWAHPMYGYTHLAPSSRVRGAKRAGVLFENKVNDALTAKHSEYLSGLGFTFSDNGVRGICIPDGVLYDPGRLVIVEIKLRHCIDAWHHLRRLYAPVVSLAYQRPVCCVEIVKYFDRNVKFPEPIKLIRSLEEATEGCLGVLIWGR